MDPPVSSTLHVSPLDSTGLYNNPLESSGPFYLSNFTLFVSPRTPLDSTTIHWNPVDPSTSPHLSPLDSSGLKVDYNGIQWIPVESVGVSKVLDECALAEVLRDFTTFQTHSVPIFHDNITHIL